MITTLKQNKVSSQICDPPPMKEILVHMYNFKSDEIAVEAVPHALRGECVLCIANTVETAQKMVPTHQS